MPNKSNISYFIVLILFSVSMNSFAQSQLKSITTAFDQIVGHENLGINNGIFNLLDYPYVIPERTKYFLNKGYSTGNLIYDDQPYYDVQLKYDLHQDILIYKPKNSGATIGCNLIQHKVASFSLYDRKFVYLNNLKIPAGTAIPEGYYQKNEIDEHFVLYIKYEKSRGNMIKDGEVYYFYTPDYHILLHYDTSFTELSSINDVLDIFPMLSGEIRNFYSLEKLLKKDNPPLFYEKLMFYILDLLQN